MISLTRLKNRPRLVNSDLLKFVEWVPTDFRLIDFAGATAEWRASAVNGDAR